MIKQLSALFSKIDVKNAQNLVSSDKTQKFLKQSLTSADTFVKEEIPKMKQATENSMETLKKNSEAIRKMMNK